MNKRPPTDMSPKHKRVGILTFHYVLNPGSALQAYSLYRSVNELSPDIECDVINYQKKNYSWNRCRARSRNTLLCALRYIPFSISLSVFQKFEKKFITGRRKIIKRAELTNIAGQYDYFIVGSDQVWNPQLLWFEQDDTYFLDFCTDSDKKISYAASIGLPDFPENDKPRLEKFLADFKSMSVREALAQDIIEKLIGRRPELVVDPTVLLNKEQWEDVAISPKVNGNYIFLYLRNRNVELASYARAMAEMKGLKIIEYHSHLRKMIWNDKLLYFIEPREWLGWLLNAKYVFTDSFHGCIFCINCNKQFFVKSSYAQSSSRIYNILEKYGMQSRLIENEQDLFSKTDIDFSMSNSLLALDRDRSLDWLKEALGVKNT